MDKLLIQMDKFHFAFSNNLCEEGKVKLLATMIFFSEIVENV